MKSLYSKFFRRVSTPALFGPLHSASSFRHGYRALSLLPAAVLMLGLLSLSRCQNWEPVEGNLEPSLNVFALLALDDSLTSTVVVHRTLPTSGSDRIVTGYDTLYFEAWDYYNEKTGQWEADTFWYDEPLIQERSESLYLVKDAEVLLSDGAQTWSFVLRPDTAFKDLRDDYWYGYSELLQDPAAYIPADSSFRPQPGQNYTLQVTAPGGLSLTGALRMPPLPIILEDLLPDTLSLSKPFTVAWTDAAGLAADISINSGSWDYLCGAQKSTTLRPGDSTWTVNPDPGCIEYNQSEWARDQKLPAIIRVRLMDENYNEYFGVDADLASVNNFLMGEGNIGLSVGVEGGYGVFGALSSARITRVLVP